MSNAVTVTLVNRLEEIERLAAHVEAFAAAHRLGEDIAYALNLALDELVTNVISYAYADAEEHQIEVTLQLEPGVLRARVRDDGRAFDPLKAPPPDLDAPIEERAIGGLGLHIVRQMMDAVEYRRDPGHNVVTLAKRVP